MGCPEVGQIRLPGLTGKMKLSLVLLAALFVVALAGGDGQHQHQHHTKTADKAWLKKEKQILELFYHINQPSHQKEHVDIAKSWSINEHVDNYKKPEVVKQFVHTYKYGYLPKGHIFSVFYDEHLEQAIALFKLFYYAKDYETFYKTAVWARQHINEGMFLYAVSVAIVHRPDTYGIVLPPIYEVYPHYFHSSDVIHQAYMYKQMHDDKHSDQENKMGQNVQGHQHHEGEDHGEQEKHGRYTGYTVVANYSGHYLNLHPEQSMSYYMEDVGINAFYYYYNLYYPFWMDGEEYGLKNDRRGEMYYYFYQQVLARYYLERLSNDFGEIQWINWEVPVETPYYPSLQYPNGMEFPERPAFAKLQEYYYNYGQKWTAQIYGYSYSFVRDYERRINDAVDSGYVMDAEGKKMKIDDSEEGRNMLGNVIEGNHDSPNRYYYGPMEVVARHLLGYSRQPKDQYHVAPSALEHYETSMRDPAFYQMYKKIVLKFQRYYANLHPYTEKELSFQGVKVTKVDVDPLITYKDYFYTDLSNAVYDNEHELEHNTFHVRARQARLNHKPFSYKITVNSDKSTKASVKVFLGPKYDEYGRCINMSENRMNMVEIDHFVYELKSGENVITRDCQDNFMYGPDRTSYSDLYRKVMDAYEGRQEYQIDGRDHFFRFPQRYMLPKGTPGGMPYQIYVIVYKYEPYQGKDQEEKMGEYNYPKVGSGGIPVDGYPMAYPFDRFIKYEKMWEELPNTYSHEVKIYYKHAEDINASHH